MGAQLSAVCFGTLAQRGQQSRQAIWKFLDAAPQAIRLFDVNLRQGFYDRESILEGCQRATIVKLNEEELPIVARELQLQESPTELQLRQFRAKFDLAAVVYTRGVRGTLMALADEIIDSPPVKFSGRKRRRRRGRRRCLCRRHSRRLRARLAARANRCAGEQVGRVCRLAAGRDADFTR